MKSEELLEKYRERPPAKGAVRPPWPSMSTRNAPVSNLSAMAKSFVYRTYARLADVFVGVTLDRENVRLDVCAGQQIGRITTLFLMLANETDVWSAPLQAIDARCRVWKTQSKTFRGISWLNRDDGPAVEGDDGCKAWISHDVLHRDDGPAVEHPQSGLRIWFRHGLIHRDYGPAVESTSRIAWYRNGELHRDDGPAVIEQEPLSMVRSDGATPYLQLTARRRLRWYKHGKEVEADQRTQFEFGAMETPEIVGGSGE